MSSETKNDAKKLSYTELGSFFENMGMMVKSGISVSEAVSLLKEETPKEDQALFAALGSMSDELSMGYPLEDAMKGSGAFPDYAVDMIGTSEYTGRLEDTLFHLSGYYRTENSMKNTLTSAVRYPVILLFMVIAVLIVMLALVFPAFYGVYNNLTGSLTASSYGYINASFMICRIMLAVMIVLVIVLIGGITMWNKGNKTKVRGFLSKFATFRELFDSMDLYRFTSCFDMFLSSGEHQDEALKKSLPVVEGSSLRAKLDRCIEKMEGGMSFSQTAYEEKLYDPTNNRMLIPAERSGMLDAIMQKILGNLGVSIEEKIGHIANTVEPMLTGFLMIFIGIMLISLMVPLIGIMNSIG
ncbi:MAG: type II secretion system F family protein [Clostridiales bacterium]|nr:type II secretion system F family protein [Clostridiales bacterium]